MTGTKKRILIAHSSPKFRSQLLDSDLKETYLLESAENGLVCAQKIAEFTPDLLIVELLLPGKHGVELLKSVKAQNSKIGVIVVSSQAIAQNQRSALENGADYFLPLPTPTQKLSELIEDFFQGKLLPSSQIETPLLFSPSTPDYKPKTFATNHYIRFWGTRGSTPVSGSEYERFGGNTSCLEVRQGDDLIIIDAGSGIRPLGLELLARRPKHIHLFISHYHWDHILGFPFFRFIYDEECEISIWSPVGFDQTAEEIFHKILAPSFFPIRLDEIKAKITFNQLRDLGTVKIGSISVEVCHTYHPSATLGFKISCGGKSLGYITDNEIAMGYHGSPRDIPRDHPLLEPHNQMIELFQGVDLMIHEAQYTPTEYKKKASWGHSSIANAALLMKFVQPKQWYVTHHDPSHTDKDLEKKLLLHKDVLRECEISCEVEMAFDGLTLPFPQS